jgi:hypothetical protein
MGKRKRSEHPELEQLAEHAAGRLDAAEAEVVRRHLQDCPFCRLELKRLARFETIATDEELLVEAEWSRARFALARAYQEKLKPELEGLGTPAAIPPPGGQVQPADLEHPADLGHAVDPKSPRGEPRRPATVLRWLAPVAAVAAVVLLLVNIDLGPDRPLPADLQDLWRGEETVEQVIVPVSPVGELANWPEFFRWRSSEEFDAFALEIFTPDLHTVFQQAQILADSLAVADSLRTLLAPEQIYLWSVRGYVDVAPVTTSVSGWFEIRPE